MENGCGHGNEGMTWENGNDMHTLPCVKWIARRKLMYRCRELVSGLCGDLEGVANGKEVKGYRYIPADSLRCTAETSTTP